MYLWRSQLSNENQRSERVLEPRAVLHPGVCWHPAHKNLHRFGSILCWCSPRMGIWNRVHEIQSLKINVGRYFILETLKHVLYTLQYIRLQYIATFKKRKQKLQREYLASCLWSFEKTWETNQEWLWSLQKRYSNI